MARGVQLATWMREVCTSLSKGACVTATCNCAPSAAACRRYAGTRVALPQAAKVSLKHDGLARYAVPPLLRRSPDLLCRRRRLLIAVLVIMASPALSRIVCRIARLRDRDRLSLLRISEPFPWRIASGEWLFDGTERSPASVSMTAQQLQIGRAIAWMTGSS
jgi:hypothetical protein